MSDEETTTTAAIDVPQTAITNATPPATATQQPMDPKLAAFISKYKERFSMWAKANGNVQFPVVMDRNGDYRWLTRAERRSLQKRQK